MKKIFLLLALVALLCSCFTPSRIEPSVKEYTFNNMGRPLNYTAGKATYNSEKKFGTITRTLPDSKTCTLASVQKNDYIYMITGTTSLDDKDDICKVIAKIWEDRAEF